MSYINNSRQAILHLMSLQGDQEQAEIHGILGISRRQSSRLLKQLKESNLIQFIKAVPSEGKGPARNILGLTLRGLIYTLSIDLSLMDKLEVIADKNTRLMPILFNKIEFFKNEGILDLIKRRAALFAADSGKVLSERIDRSERLYNALEKTQPPVEFDLDSKDFIESSMVFNELFFFDYEEELRHMLLFGTCLETPESRQNTLLIMGKDQDLRSYFLDWFKDQERHYSELLENTRDWHSWFKKAIKDI
jgi:hypothetical protein